MDQVLQRFTARVSAARKSKTALRICGGHSKNWYGQSLIGEIFDTREYSGITAYDPTELVITARCGTPMAEIDATLAQHNQMIAFEPPKFGLTSTYGGMIASGLSGPRRFAVGAARDYVLGVVLLDGNGNKLRFGGQVMKNVAGYDVSRLLCGSLGTLGLILEASIKVLPRPAAETTLRLLTSHDGAIRYLNEWGRQPLPLSASAWHEGVLSVRLSGAEAAVIAARKRIGGEEEPKADLFWAALREQEHEFFSVTDPAVGIWRLSVPSVVPSLALAGAQLLEWGGAQRWLKTDQRAAAIRDIAQKVGGHATLFRGGNKEDGVFHPLAPVIAKIHRNLKAAFDPSGIFNPGRIYKQF